MSRRVLAALLTLGSVLPMAEAQQTDDEAAARLRERLAAQADKVLNFDGLRVISPHLDEEAAKPLADVLQTSREWLGANGMPMLTSTGLDARIRLVDGAALNAYTAGTAAITLMFPDIASFEVGTHVHQQTPMAVLDLMVETGWTRVLKPMWSMPYATRMAINRLYATPLAAHVAAEHGEEWWFGRAAADPKALPLGFPPDHPLVVDWKSSLAALRAFEAEHGLQRLSVRLKNWNDRRLPGDQAFDDLLSLLGELSGDGAMALLPDVEFETKQAWAGPTAARIKGLKYFPRRRSGVTVEFYYRERKEVPRDLVSVKGGAPTVGFRSPQDGRVTWKLDQVHTVLQKEGAFTDERFHLVLMDGKGRETFRWSYPIVALPEVSERPEWIALDATAFPVLSHDYFVAFEFPELAEGQNVHIGHFKLPSADHTYRSQPGRRIASAPEGGDYAVVVHARGNSTNLKLLPRMIDKMMRDN